MNAATRYPHPIRPSIPHQLVINEPLFSNSPDLNLKIRKTRIATPANLKPAIVKKFFSFSGYLFHMRNTPIYISIAQRFFPIPVNSGFTLSEFSINTPIISRLTDLIIICLVIVYVL